MTHLLKSGVLVIPIPNPNIHFNTISELMAKYPNLWIDIENKNLAIPLLHTRKSKIQEMEAQDILEMFDQDLEAQNG
jgi:hypothetical protein